MINKLEYGLEMLENLKINESLMQEKEISSYQEYFQVQSLYKKGFEFYLEEKLNLSDFNQAIKESKYHFEVVKEKELYHQNSYLNLEYLYIRNFLFIEKLTKEEIEFLKRRVEENNYNVDEALIDLVKSTFLFVSQVNTKALVVNYGIESPINHFSPDAMAIYIVYGKNKQKLDKEAYIKDRKEKELFLEVLIQELKEKGREEFIKIECIYSKKM